MDEQLAFAGRLESVELQHVFFYVRVNEQVDFRLLIGEVVESRERNRDVIADAADVDNHLVRFFGKQCAAEMRNHCGRDCNRTERGSAGSTSLTCERHAFDPALPRSVLWRYTDCAHEVRENIRTNNEPLECLPSLPQCASQCGNQNYLVAGAGRAVQSQLSPDPERSWLLWRVWCAWCRLLCRRSAQAHHEDTRSRHAASRRYCRRRTFGYRAGKLQRLW